MPDKSTHLTLRCLDCPRRLSVPFYALSQGRDHLAAVLFETLDDEAPWLLRASMPPAVGILKRNAQRDTAPALGPVCDKCARKTYSQEEIEVAHARLRRYVEKRSKK